MTDADIIIKRLARIEAILLDIFPEDAKIKCEADSIRQRLQSRQYKGRKRHEREIEQKQ